MINFFPYWGQHPSSVLLFRYIFGSFPPFIFILTYYFSVGTVYFDLLFLVGTVSFDLLFLVGTVFFTYYF